MAIHPLPVGRDHGKRFRSIVVEITLIDGQVIKQFINFREEINTFYTPVLTGIIPDHLVTKIETRFS